MQCDICGWELKTTTWYEEAWGRPVKCYDYECVNPSCGEESEDE
jgi:hypothetical protein